MSDVCVIRNTGHCFVLSLLTRCSEDFNGNMRPFAGPLGGFLGSPPEAVDLTSLPGIPLEQL